MVGVALCLTIVGSRFGIASFKLAGLAIAPFGREIVDVEEADSAVAVQVQPLGSSEPVPAA